ncbi:SOCS box domain-containing protein [Trichonephila inaurata madagascariensis]|nr:SOCS box domain-containing protein [Trichonephila inaurata madagascariensis]
MIDFFITSHSPLLVDFVLYHSTLAKRRIFGGELDWRRIRFSLNLGCFYQLIKYGYNYPFFPGNFLRRVRVHFEYNCSPRASRNLFVTRREAIYMLTTIFLFGNEADQPMDLAELFWDTIPDLFFTRFEIYEICDEFDVYPVIRNRFIRSYESKISSGYLKGPIPRSLIHLCRCSIRKHMSSLFQLPRGIDTLTIPEKLKEYLRLSIPHEFV